MGWCSEHKVESQIVEKNGDFKWLCGTHRPALGKNHSLDDWLQENSREPKVYVSVHYSKLDSRLAPGQLGRAHSYADMLVVPVTAQVGATGLVQDKSGTAAAEKHIATLLFERFASADSTFGLEAREIAVAAAATAGSTISQLLKPACNGISQYASWCVAYLVAELQLLQHHLVKIEFDATSEIQSAESPPSHTVIQLIDAVVDLVLSGRASQTVGFPWNAKKEIFREEKVWSHMCRFDPDNWQGRPRDIPALKALMEACDPVDMKQQLTATQYQIFIWVDLVVLILSRKHPTVPARGKPNPRRRTGMATAQPGQRRSLALPSNRDRHVRKTSDNIRPMTTRN